MVPDDTYTRRICAVLLADVSGFSAMMGEDDEGTVRAVHRLTHVVEQVVSASGGRAEPRAGDAILATFDSVTGAVETAVEIQHRVATEEFASRRLRMSIGIHFGDVIWQGETPRGDAINIAARLQALARPGTICVSESVRRHVRGKLDAHVEDLGRQRLKNISDPVHAFLIVPASAGGASRPRSAAGRWLMRGAIALGVVAVTALVHHGAKDTASVPTGEEPPAEPPPTARRVDAPGAAAVPAVAEDTPAEAEPVGLGVMLFKSRGGDASDAWMGEALRDGLNAQLSQLSSVKVYSKEFIDFLITRNNLTEVEAATKLGIKKMLSGSFLVMGGNLQVETHVVDVTTGVIESAYTTKGSTEGFFDLQNEVTLHVIARLNLPMTADEERLLLAQRDQDVEALKMLLEAEGGGGQRGSPPPKKDDGGRSALPRWLAGLSAGSAWASAEEPADPEAEIRDMLERYRKATEEMSIDGLAGVHVEFPDEKRAAQQRYFDNVEDLRIAIEDIDIAVIGDEAVVSYTRTDDFSDARTGRDMHVSVRLTKMLRRQDGTWKIVGTQ